MNPGGVRANVRSSPVECRLSGSLDRQHWVKSRQRTDQSAHADEGWSIHDPSGVRQNLAPTRAPLMALFAADSTLKNLVAGARFVNYRLSLAA